MKTNEAAHDLKKKNPIHNRALMKKINPYNETRRKLEKAEQEERHKKRQAAIKTARKASKKDRVARRKRFIALQTGLQTSFADAEKKWLKEEAEGLEQVAVSSEDDE